VTTIRLRAHGPYVIEGDDVRVIDWDGREYPIERRPVALCRCGQSGKKPFCDGSHRNAGFDGGPSAPPAPAPEGESGPSEG
jgi:CDGSH-type Zn-finger protein